MPKKRVSVGESWTYSMTIPLGTAFSPSVTGKRTFLGRKNGLVVIDEKSTFTTDASKKMTLPVASGPKSPSTSIYFAMKGTMTGQTTVDETTGFIGENNSSQRIGGRITVIVPGAKTTRVSFPLYGLVETKSTTTDISVTP